MRKYVVLLAFLLCTNVAYSQDLRTPLAFIEYQDSEGNAQRYYGVRLPSETGSPMISQQDLQNVTRVGVGALDDDGLESQLDWFSVIGFEMAVADINGNIVILPSDSNTFTDEQKAFINELQQDRQFYIVNTKAIGPDEKERKIAPMRVVVE